MPSCGKPANNVWAHDDVAEDGAKNRMPIILLPTDRCVPRFVRTSKVLEVEPRGVIPLTFAVQRRIQ